VRIPVRDIPQADSMSDVLAVVESVGGGARTYQDVAAAIEKVGCQGRYYRRAAAILGLIGSAGSNFSVLTSLGRRYLSGTKQEKKDILASAVLRAPLFQRVIPFLESKLPAGCTRGELIGFVKDVTERTGPTMLPRRAATIVAWLEYAGMLRKRRARHVLVVPSFFSHPVQYASDEEPLLPTTFRLKDYESAARRTARLGDMLRYTVNAVKRERANQSHEMLTNLVASKLRAAGSFPRCNRLIDVAARIGNRPYIFEIKSTNPRNCHQQLRRGLSQLYEYRYLHGAENAQLVLVVQHPVSAHLDWAKQYLFKDRGIHLAWDGEGRTLHCSDPSRRLLRFLL